MVYRMAVKYDDAKAERNCKMQASIADVRREYQEKCYDFTFEKRTSQYLQLSKVLYGTEEWQHFWQCDQGCR